jgi:hypothetical protein
MAIKIRRRGKMVPSTPDEIMHTIAMALAGMERTRAREFE